MGHRRVAFLYPDTRSGSTRNRLNGFREAMASAGLEPLACAVTEHEAPALDIARLREFLRVRHPDVTTVVCFNDPLAMTLLGPLREMGLAVPNELSIVGYGDDLQWSEEMKLPLTTVDQCPHEVGAVAARSLLGLLSGRRPPASQAVPVSLVVRESVAAPRTGHVRA
jgi:LacI family transcriptional regulator